MLYTGTFTFVLKNFAPLQYADVNALLEAILIMQHVDCAAKIAAVSFSKRGLLSN